jgi:nitroreductase
MDTIKTLLEHRTIRNYESTPIAGNILNTILESATRASTTGNMQLYSIIVSKDEEMKKKLCDLHFKQKMVIDAPVMLTFCADIRRFSKWCVQRKAEPAYDNFLWFINASIDAIIATQNAVIAAESFGLGICYLGTVTYNADKIIELLQCPEYVVPITSIVIGYPAVTPPLTDRLPLEAVVHQETYLDYSESDIDRLYEEKEALPLTKALLEENQLETLAQVFTLKRYARNDNLFFSKKFMEAVVKQGFKLQE